MSTPQPSDSDSLKPLDLESTNPFARHLKAGFNALRKAQAAITGKDPSKDTSLTALNLDSFEPLRRAARKVIKAADKLGIIKFEDGLK